MDKNTVYILQKDLPYVKAGVEYKFDGEHYVCDETSKFTTDIYSDRLHKKSVENNLEWFKPKEEVNESKPTEPQQKWWQKMGIKFDGKWYTHPATNTYDNLAQVLVELREYLKYAPHCKNYATDIPVTNVKEEPIVKDDWVSCHGVDIQVLFCNDDTAFFVNGTKAKLADCKKINLPAPKEEPQWEILEYKNTTNGDVFTFQSVCNNSIYSDGFKDNTSEFSKQDCFIIESVKRFPDNTVWSVDMVTEHGIITAFKIIDKDMWAVIKGKLYEVPLVALEEAPKEEQVPIKVNGIFDLLNEDKIKHEKLLSKIESKVRLANMINTQVNYLKETLDYINSLK